jgi:hypothetical protein
MCVQLKRRIVDADDDDDKGEDGDNDEQKHGWSGLQGRSCWNCTRVLG